MAIVTFDMLKRWGPCVLYSDNDYASVKKLMGGRESMTHHEVAKLDIPIWDRYWVLIRLLNQANRRLIACDIAEEALNSGSVTDPALWNAINISRKYAHDLATDNELQDACDVAHRARWKISRQEGTLLEVAEYASQNAALRAAWETAAVATESIKECKAMWAHYVDMAILYINKQEKVNV